MKVACIQLSSGKDYTKNLKDIIKYYSNLNSAIPKVNGKIIDILLCKFLITV